MISYTGSRDSGFGIRDSEFRIRGSEFGFWVPGLENGVGGLGLEVSGLDDRSIPERFQRSGRSTWYKMSSLGFRVLGLIATGKRNLVSLPNSIICKGQVARTIFRFWVLV